MTAKPLKKGATYDDLRDVPDHFVAEMFDGELYASPRPTFPHAVPDLAGWRRQRLPSLPADAYLTLAPDWICEVLSPGTEGLDRGKKLRIYARERVAHAWLLDPLRHTLEVMSLDAGRWTVLSNYEGENGVRAVPFDAIELELGALWI
jgi:Uma2 family endonuclease